MYLSWQVVAIKGSGYASHLQAGSSPGTRVDITGFPFRLGEKRCTMDSSNYQRSSYFNITERIHH
jgi:hypothetical protein